jgi:hypothetical protein
LRRRGASAGGSQVGSALGARYGELGPPPYTGPPA